MAQALTIIGTLISAASAIDAGNKAKDAKEDAAELAQEEAKIKAEKQARETALLLSQQQAAYASSGVDLEGTPLAVIEQTSREAAQEREEILRLGGMRADILNQEGADLWQQGIGQGVGTFLTGTGKFLDSKGY